MAGFGRSAFGVGPFGQSDTGGDLIVNLFPEELFDNTLILPPGQTLTNNTVDPLLKLLKMYANSVFQRRLDIENLESILDPEVADLEWVQLFGSTLGIDVDKNDPEFLQRSFLNNASQWLQIKASTKGYEVRGLASGFAVSITNYWRIDQSYQPLIPAFFLFNIKSQYADPGAPSLLYTDKPPGTFAGTPAVEDPTYAKSAFLTVVFSVVEYQPDVDYNTLLNLVILKIADVQGIHQEPTAPQFLVSIPVNVNLTASMVVEEASYPIAPEQERYDVTPADVISDDGPITVSIVMTPSTSVLTDESGNPLTTEGGDNLILE